MSPLVWDLGAHRRLRGPLARAPRSRGEPLLRADLAAMYDAFETPRAVRGDLELLDRAERARLPRDGARARRSTALADARHRRRLVYEMVLRHELQHTETMLPDDAARPAAARAAPAPRPRRGRRRHTGRSASRSPAGAFAHRRRRRTASPTTTSARATRVDVAAFRDRPHAGHQRDLADASPRAAATSAASGGPTRAGRGRQEYDITHPLAGRAAGRRAAIDGSRRWTRRPVSTSPGSRPTPSPARRRAAADRGRVGEGGDLGPGRAHPGARAAAGRNLDQLASARAGRRLPEGASVRRAQMLGDVWEWTASDFDGYPGFARLPLPRVLRGLLRRRLQVLRGGSWATQPRVATHHVPQLGPAPSAARSSPAAAAQGC